jgi:GT2 family glycosyltransferase
LPSRLVETDYPKFEIIVVDNGSSDHSIDYLRYIWEHRIRIIELPENLGFAEGNNIGIQNSYDVIALLNNDIEVEQNWLRRGVESLMSDKNVAAVQPKIMQYVDLSWRLKLLGYRMLLALSSVVYHIGQGSSNTIPTSFVVFHTTKNYISLWLKNCGLRTLIFKIPSIRGVIA